MPRSVLGDVIAPAGLRDKALHRHQAGIARCRRAQTLAGAAEDRKARSAAVPQRERSAAIAGAVQGVEGARRLPLYRHHLDHATPTFAAIEAVLGAREAGFRADRLFARRPRSRKAHPAARGRGQGRRAHRVAVRPRPAVPRRARQGAARLGARLRRELGAVLPQISARRSAGDRRHSRHCRCGAYDRQRSAPCAARCPTPISAGKW